jgi:stalled ribosome rescue protein Dom34
MQQTAMWIDSHEARVFHVDVETFDESTIHSAAHHVHRHPKDRETRTRNHPQDEARFFGEIVTALKDREEILIVGPSVTKLRFLKYAQEYAPVVASHVVGVESADHPSDRELVAHVRQYFHTERPRLSGPPRKHPELTG